MRTSVFGFILVLACLVLLPVDVLAQSEIAGVVKDASGSVLPGVTVEVASPALIEKSRAAVTDGDVDAAAPDESGEHHGSRLPLHLS